MSATQDIPAQIGDLFGLNGKVALVLGAGQGMGESCAKLLALAGCDLILAEIIPERAARVAADIRAMGRRAHEAIGDMCDPAQVDELLPKAEAALGGVDVVVSIIGEAGWFSVLDTSREDWARDQRRNLDYFFYCSQWAARSMVRRGRGGAICAIASVDGLQASPMHAAYGVAKAGIISLVKTMAAELGRDGIRVNAVAPGIIKTPRAVARSSPEAVDQMARDGGLPLGRAGTTAEVANAVLYLVSDMARYVTGITLPMDGGWLASRLDIGRYVGKA
jgi:2-deoxy-D-gluconate 3-dehydrogenase